MKISKNLIAIFLLLHSFASCTNKEKPALQKIDFPRKIILNPSEAITDSMNLSDIAEKVEYIPLQTVGGELIPFINELVVTKKYYFLKIGHSIYNYDLRGRFNKSLFKVGRGPGEVAARSFAVDDSGDFVYVYNHFESRVKIYDYNGTFIKTVKKPIDDPALYTTSIGFFNNTLFVATIQNPESKYTYSYFDINNDSIRILYKNYNRYEKSSEKKQIRDFPFFDYNYQITDSSILFKEKYCDTIFKANKAFKIEPRFIFDLGNQKLKWEDYRDNVMFKPPGPMPFPFGYWIESFAESRSFLFLVLRSYNDPEIFAVYNKSTESVKLSTNKYYKNVNSQVYLKNDIDKIVSFPPMNSLGKLFYYDECLYSIIEAKDFITGCNAATYETKNSTEYLRKMAPVFESITEFSNPIIMKVYLK